MLALAASRSGALTAEAARERGVPVLLFQGGIHAGEIDGKDAGFLALRELLDDKAAKGALDGLVVLFVPVFNVDGHERFGRWNRPNQRGPEEKGWRVTAQNLNLNRDYSKADTPEMQAMLRLVEAWDPIVYTDLHATDGAQSSNSQLFVESEVAIANVRWLSLDIARVVTRGDKWVQPDLSRVDEVGFADLHPGSGHGWGGFVNVGRIEVYGTPVKR